MESLWAHWFEIAVGLFLGLVAFVFTGTCGVFLWYLNQLREDAKGFNTRLENITSAVQGIGTQMGVVVERTIAHEKRLDRVETKGS